MALISCIFLLVSIVISRILLRLVSLKDGLFDTWFHIYLIKLIRDNGFKAPLFHTRSLSKQLINSTYYFHWLMAFFPRKQTDIIIYYFNSILDLALGIFTAWFVYVLFDDEIKSILALTLYLSTPLMFTTIALGPRVQSYTPRLTSEVCINLLTILVLLLYSEKSYLYVSLSIILSILVWGGSSFSRQAIILCFPIYYLLSGNNWALVAIVSGFAGNLIISRSRFIDTIKRKYLHFVWYIRQINQRKILVSNRNLGQFIEIIFEKNNMKKTIDALFWQAMKHNPFILLIVKFPIIWMLPLFFPSDFSVLNMDADNIEHQMIMVYLSALFIWLLTSTRHLLFLGESERYIMNFTVFIIILSVNYVPVELILICVTYGIIYCCFEVLYKIKMSKKGQTKEQSEEVYRFLNTIPEKKRCATIPLGLGGWGILVHTEQMWLSPLDVIYEYEKAGCFESYQLIDLKRIDKAIGYFDLDIILIDERILKKKVNKLKVDGFNMERLADDVLVLIKSNIKHESNAAKVVYN